MGDLPIPLNETGQRQAAELASLLAKAGVVRLYSSPVVRALQTAHILNAQWHADIAEAVGFSEIGVGAWKNRFWSELAEDPAKRDWYSRPEEARPEGGETLSEVQRRAVAAMREIVRADDDCVAVVTHADIIRVILAHYLHIHPAGLRKLAVDHAAVTVLHISPQESGLLLFNYRRWPHASFCERDIPPPGGSQARSVESVADDPRFTRS